MHKLFIVMVLLFAFAAEGASPSFQQFNANIWVSTNGNNSTGARNGLPFANLYRAAGASQAGDVIYVWPGVYNEGTNVVPHIPGRRIVGIGNPVLQFYATNSIINSNNIYLKPADNLYVEGITIEPKSTNWFNAAFGTTTNSPGATNWLVRNMRMINLDSDGVYFNSTNLCIGRIEGLYGRGYWDVYTTGVSVNTNSVVEVVDFFFDATFNNGITPSGGTRPINIQPGGMITKFSRGTIRATKSGMMNVGASLGGGFGLTELNNVMFDVLGNTNLLIIDNTARVYVNNCTTVSNTTFYIENASFVSVNTGPYYGSSYTFVMNKSYDVNSSAFIYGEWVAQDMNETNTAHSGALVFTNLSIADLTTPVSIAFVPNNDLDGGTGGLEVGNGRLVASLGMPTNSANLNIVTNEFQMNRFYTNINQRATVRQPFAFLSAVATSAVLAIYLDQDGSGAFEQKILETKGAGIAAQDDREVNWTLQPNARFAISNESGVASLVTVITNGGMQYVRW